MSEDEKTKDNALTRAPKERGLVSRSAALTKRGLESLKTHDRIVRFPSDISIGDVYLFDNNSDVSNWHEYLQDEQRNLFSQVEEIQNVSGDLHVSYGKDVVLVISERHNAASLHYLLSLAPDSLQGLHSNHSFFIEDLSLISHLTKLKYLSTVVEPIEIDVAWQFEALANLINLQVLILEGNEGFADPDFSLDFGFLTKLKSLKHLRMSGNYISRQSETFNDLQTDEYKYIFNIKELVKLNQLQTLGLPLTSIGSESLKHFGSLTNLRELDLSLTRIDDFGLRYLSKLTSLSRLDLIGVQITNVGLSYLQNLPLLSILLLSETKIKDSDLPYLNNLTSLSYLDLSGTEITRSGIEALREQLPNCYINWSDPLKDLYDIFDDDFVIEIIDAAISQVNEGSLTLKDFSQRMESIFEPEEFEEFESYLPLIFDEAKQVNKQGKGQQRFQKLMKMFPMLSQKAWKLIFNHAKDSDE